MALSLGNIDGWNKNLLLAAASATLWDDARKQKCTCVDLPSARILLRVRLQSRLQTYGVSQVRQTLRSPYFFDFGRQNGRYREVY